MNTFTIDGWCKPESAAKSASIGMIHFRVDEQYHLQMEQAEEELIETHDPEKFIDADASTMELSTSDECGQLKDVRFRVYLNPNDQRGHFHLIAKRASDDALVYSNAVMVDQLG